MLKKRISRFNLALIVVLTATLFLTIGVAANLSSHTAEAADITLNIGETLTLGDSPSGTVTVIPGSTNVTIDGTVTGKMTGITLDIGAGAEVHWIANFQGASDTYFVTVKGSGTLDIDSCTIANTGKGGAINIIGIGTTVSLGVGAIVFSGTNGNGILISVNNVTINVNSGSTVMSLDGNGNAAIQVGSGSNNNIQNAKINVDGGSVVSIGTGYAINDSAGTGTVTNNTMISITSGEVIAGTACAIRSMGTDSTVTIAGGTISNAAGNNANPAIFMNAGSGENVTISGGIVQSMSNAGYAVQTTGDISVSGGLVTAINGRAINLIGMTSTAEISGGTVQTIGNGTAISTATTNPETVAGASVKVNGGTVSSINGFAINITGANSSITVSGGTVTSTSDNTLNAIGANSSITVSGGTVTSTSGHTINATGANSSITVSGGAVSAVTGNGINTTAAAKNASIAINGGKVSSSTGRAIQSSGDNSSITVNDLNSQVWVMTRGNAIRSSGTVAILNGFVFAFGTNVNAVISAPSITWPTIATGGVVVAWNQGQQLVYSIGGPTGNRDDLVWYETGVSTLIARWATNPTQGNGIFYSQSITSGFFPLPDVIVVRDHGLIFDTLDGVMYRNYVDPTNPGNYGIPNVGLNTRAFFVSNWVGTAATPTTPATLTLTGLVWNTSTPVALTIYGGDVDIYLGSGSSNIFTSTFTPIGSEDSFGIKSDYTVNVYGDGTLNATGGSFGIGADSLAIHSGTVKAGGGTSAFDHAPDTLPDAYTYWINTNNTDPGGPGTTYFNIAYTPDPYEYDSGNMFTKISSGSYAIVQDGTVTGTMGTPMTAAPSQTAEIDLYGATVNGAVLSNFDASGWFASLPRGVTVLANANTNDRFITLTFGGTPNEGSTTIFDMTIPGSVLNIGTDLTVEFNPNAMFDINGTYSLFADAGTNGSLSGTASGQYAAGEPISITATENKGYYFTGWFVNGAAITGGLKANPATFNMPSNNVILIATWASSSTSPPSGGITNASINNSSAVFDKYPAGSQHTDITVTLSPGNYVLLDIKYGGYTLKAGTDYIVNGNTYTIKKEYLSTLDLGEQIFTFDMSGSTDPVLTVTVIDTTPAPHGDDTGGIPKTKEMAILNLICMVLSIVICLIVVTTFRDKNHKNIKIENALRLFSLIIAIVAIILFFLTEEFGGKYVPYDEWSAAMVILMLAAVFLLLAYVRYDHNRE